MKILEINIPVTFIFSNVLNVGGIDANYLLYKPYAYSIRFGVIVPSFGQTEPQLTMTSTKVTNCVCTVTGYPILTIHGFHNLILKYLLMLPMLLHQ